MGEDVISHRQADLLERLNPSHEMTLDFHFDAHHNNFYCIAYNPNDDKNMSDVFYKSQVSSIWHTLYNEMHTFNPNDIIFRGCTADFDTSQWRDIHDILENFRAGMESAGYKIKKTEDNIFKSSRKDNEGSRYFTAYKVILPRY